MSTRAVYGFRDGGGLHHVFVHHDGYPSGAADKFKDVLASNAVWKLPRFEADEFAAGFVSVNKTSGGSVRLSHGPEYHADIEYYYIVYQPASDHPLYIEAYDVPFDHFANKKLLFKGPLTEFIATADKIEEEDA